MEGMFQNERQALANARYAVREYVGMLDIMINGPLSPPPGLTREQVAENKDVMVRTAEVLERMERELKERSDIWLGKGEGNE